MTTTITAEPQTNEIVLSREFDAPCDLVYRVVNDPQLVNSWWGPRKYTTEVVEMEARAGGSWRYIQRDGEGNEYAFRGVYHHCLPSTSICRTFEFEGAPGHVALETLTLEDLGDGRCRLTTSGVYQSLMDRDMVLQSGMESGARETYERLAALLEERKGR